MRKIIMENNCVFIHYGSNKFDIDLIKKNSMKIPTYRSPYDKPSGLWGSPINSEWGWKDWCDSENWYKSDMSKSFTFALSDDARVLHIRAINNIYGYLTKTYDTFYNRNCLDLAKIYSEYDAMELHLSENYRLRDYDIFYAWDCDSICVWNHNILKEAA